MKVWVLEAEADDGYWEWDGCTSFYVNRDEAERVVAAINENIKQAAAIDADKAYASDLEKWERRKAEHDVLVDQGLRSRPYVDGPPNRKYYGRAWRSLWRVSERAVEVVG